MHSAWESVCSLEHVRVASSVAVVGGAVAWMVVSAVIAAVRAFEDEHDSQEQDGAPDVAPFRLRLLSLV